MIIECARHGEVVTIGHNSGCPRCHSEGVAKALEDPQMRLELSEAMREAIAPDEPAPARQSAPRTRMTPLQLHTLAVLYAPFTALLDELLDAEMLELLIEADAAAETPPGEHRSEP